LNPKTVPQVSRSQQTKVLEVPQPKEVGNTVPKQKSQDSLLTQSRLELTQVWLIGTKLFSTKKPWMFWNKIYTNWMLNKGRNKKEYARANQAYW
jgi:hypothetical protein